MTSNSSKLSSTFVDGPLVTVYTPCRNYGHFLSKAVQSVMDQLYQSWELFIIDEASDDETLAIAKQFQSQDPQRIKVIHHEKPLGLQKVANHVLSLAKGAYIMRLDADDWLDEGALLLMAAKLESDPDCGLVYGNYYYTDEQGKVLGAERRLKPGTENTSAHAVPPHGACTMVSTRALKSVGGYSEDINAQDGWELWFKLLNRVKSAQLDLPLFYYRQHQQSLSKDRERLLNARAEILRKARHSLAGSYQPTCLAVIPVRESYPDWQGVPYEEINGKSLLELALDSAHLAKGVTDVAVSSESQSVLDFAQILEQSSGRKNVRILRPSFQHSGTFRPQDILAHAMAAFEAERGFQPDIVLFLSIHAPLRECGHVDKAVDVLIVTRSDSVVSVNQEHEPMFRHGNEGLDLLNPGRFDGLSFEKEHLYRFNGAILGLWSNNLREGSLFGESIAYIEMSERHGFQVKQKADLTNLAYFRSALPAKASS
jgi:glycosyltransferase involved in cell wall biosynthesis